jgi:hypothetical protein
MAFARTLFRWCLFGAAFIMAGVAIYFLAIYASASLAVGNSGIDPFYGQIARSMWLGFCTQLGLLAVIFMIAASRPHFVSRQFALVLAIMPAINMLMLFWQSASRVGAIFLGIATALALTAALSWPTRVAGESPPLTSPATRQVP